MDECRQRLLAKLDEVEAELKRLGLWKDSPSATDILAVDAPFGTGAMAFEQWLQLVFLPQARRLIESQAPLPCTSQVAARAAREFDGMPETDALRQCLHEFDALVDRSTPAPGHERRRELKRIGKRMIEDRSQRRPN